MFVNYIIQSVYPAFTAHDHATISLQLLGELLLDRHNYLTMDRYIGSAENLKLMMTMLADQSRSIAYEAFHVFKVR